MNGMKRVLLLLAVKQNSRWTLECSTRVQDAGAGRRLCALCVCTCAVAVHSGIPVGYAGAARLSRISVPRIVCLMCLPAIRALTAASCLAAQTFCCTDASGVDLCDGVPIPDTCSGNCATLFLVGLLSPGIAVLRASLQDSLTEVDHAAAAAAAAGLLRQLPARWRSR